MHVTSLGPQDLCLVNEPARLVRGTRNDVRDVWQHRELLRALVARELRSRYKGTSLGWAWALVRPLVMLLVYGLAVGVFLGAGRAIPQFMIFIYAGLVGWNLFATLVLGCINSVAQNGPLISRASFPRLLLPLSAALAALVDFLLQLSVLTVGYLLFRDWPEPASLLWLPPALFVLVLTGLGLGLMLGAINVYVRDVAFLTEVGLQVGFWLAPVLYSYGQVVRGAVAFGVAPDLATRLYMLNPVANVIIGFQRALWPAATGDAAASFAFPGNLELRLAIFSGLALLVAWTGVRIFVRLSGNFGQEL